MKKIPEGKLIQHFWYDVEIADWGYYFSEQGNEELEKNVHIFLMKYILITLKYGINIPYKLTDSNEKKLSQFLEALLDKHKGSFIKNKFVAAFRDLYFFDEKFHIYSIMYMQASRTGIKCAVHSEFPELFHVQAYNADDYSLCRYYFLLTCDAFLTKLRNSRVRSFNIDYIDNSELAYMNTTRLNSYIRDVTILMFENGAKKFAYSDYYGKDTKGNSSTMEGPYLKIEDEILFYEDVYSLLPDDNKYRRFEETEVNLDKRNYLKFQKKNK